LTQDLFFIRNFSLKKAFEFGITPPIQIECTQTNLQESAFLACKRISKIGNIKHLKMAFYIRKQKNLYKHSKGNSGQKNIKVSWIKKTWICFYDNMIINSTYRKEFYAKIISFAV
jgi:hypothetical protein